MWNFLRFKSRIIFLKKLKRKVNIFIEIKNIFNHFFKRRMIYFIHVNSCGMYLHWFAYECDSFLVEKKNNVSFFFFGMCERKNKGWMRDNMFLSYFDGERRGSTTLTFLACVREKNKGWMRDNIFLSYFDGERKGSTTLTSCVFIAIQSLETVLRRHKHLDLKFKLTYT